MNAKIKEKLKLLPPLPGSYQMKNKDGVIIYVGKAKNLKNRVKSYFQGHHTGKTAKLVSEIDDFEYIVVNSEVESLVLEINFIKKYDPKYNILLRDDKSYPYIELTQGDIPSLKVVRNVSRKKNTSNLYGPYPNVTAARNTVNMLNRIYPLRKCRIFEKKPCLYYHIGECLGYCTHSVGLDKVRQMKDEIVRFLKGDSEFVINKLTNEMNEYSSNLEYERAFEIKKLIDSINTTLIRQEVEIKDNIDRDIFGYSVYKGYLSIQVFFVRNSKIVGRHSNILPMIDDVSEELIRYIAKFYNDSIIKPKEILIPDIIDVNILSEYLDVKVKVPVKGEKYRLVLMACDNASISLKEQFDLINNDEKKTVEANEELRKILNLAKLDRIELFDNSNLFGSFNVSGMVVFIDGKPAKNEYRKYKITVDKNDDYGTMKEVIYRRYFRVLKDNLTRPDLVIVDGAIGQMNIAREVISSLGLNIPVVGLKKDDKHSTNALLAFDPIIELAVDKKSNLFYYLERMQDEVHNFTISYHKQIRSKGTLESVLDNVFGIGTKYKEKLLKKYKSINKMKSISVAELCEILPNNIALNLYEFLKDYNVNSK